MKNNDTNMVAQATPSALTGVSLDKILNYVNIQLTALQEMLTSTAKIGKDHESKRNLVEAKLSPRTGKAINRHLTKTEKENMVGLLLKGDLSVALIADMFKVTRPTVYNVRDKYNLTVHRGSIAQILGARRNKSVNATV